MKAPDLTIIAAGPAEGAMGPGMGKKGGMGREQCVPVEALAMPDEAEKMTPPEVGDRVSYTVEGKVSRIEGPNAYVTVETVNGEPLGEEKPEAPDEAADDQAAYADLENQAKGMDEEDQASVTA